MNLITLLHDLHDPLGDLLVMLVQEVVLLAHVIECARDSRQLLMEPPIFHQKRVIGALQMVDMIVQIFLALRLGLMQMPLQTSIVARQVSIVALQVSILGFQTSVFALQTSNLVLENLNFGKH
jgi:hypothetical protein